MASPSFEDQWSVIQERGIDVLIDYLIRGKKPYPSVVDSSGREKTILFSNGEYAELYTTVYNMSTRGKDGNKVYQHYREVLQSFCANHMAPAMAAAAQLDSFAEYLRVISDCFNKEQVFVRWLHHIFYYLDRFHVALAGVDNLKNCSSKIWVNEYIVPITPRLIRNILAALEHDRLETLNVDPRTTTTESLEAAGSEGGLDQALAKASGESLTHQYIRNITASIMEFASYNDAPLCEYRNGVVEKTRTFYAQLATVKLQTLPISEYLLLVKKIIEDETYRTNNWLLGDVSLAVQMTLNDVMIVQPLDRLLEGMPEFLEGDCTSDLKLLYDLVVNRSHENKGVQKMSNVFKNFLINSRGMVILQEKQDRLVSATMKAKPIARLDNTAVTSGSGNASMNSTVPLSLANPDIADYAFVTKLMDLHNKYVRMIDECFSSDFNFKLKFRESFEFIMNHSIGGVHMACYISTSCDRLIRHTSPGGLLPTTQQGVVEHCNDLVSLFTYLADKDLFAHVYRNQLAKRLLGCDELPNETEKLFINTFKKVCGHSYSHKIESMLLDVQNSFDLRKQYAQERSDFSANTASETTQQRESREEEDGCATTPCPVTEDFNFTVQVLTTGMWPQTTDVTLKLPRQLVSELHLFRRWYDTKTGSRKLIWNQTASQAVLQANFQRPYFVVCNVPQACLLLLFNTSDVSDEKAILRHGDTTEPPTLTTQWLQDKTGIDAVNNKRYLKSIYIKYGLVTKVDEDSYKVNINFECPSRRFKLPLPVDGETHQKSNIEEDRSLSIQACLIRIMKTRQQCQHQELVSECLNQLSMFRPSIKQIKQQIEKCIEKDLISRLESDPQTYKYE